MENRIVYAVGRYTALGSVLVARVGRDARLAEEIAHGLNLADSRRWRLPTHFVFIDRDQGAYDDEQMGERAGGDDPATT